MHCCRTKCISTIVDEYLRIFDGNLSFNENRYRTIAVRKTATVSEIKEASMRAYHIAFDDSANFYISQIVNDGEKTFFVFLKLHNIIAEQMEEEELTDPNPLRNLRRPEGRRGRIFLRIRETETDTGKIRIYGSWLRSILYRFALH